MKSMQMFLLLIFALPVLSAQYYSLDQSPLVWFSAMLSLCLLVLLLGLVLARLPQGVIRTSVGLGMITLLACYFFGQFVSYYLQGSYFNQQFYFHFNLSSVTQTWAVYWPLTAMFMIWLTCLWLCFLYFRNRVNTFRSSEALLFGLLAAALFLDPGLRQSAIASLNGDNPPEIRSLAGVDWQRMKLDQAALENPGFSASAGKNLVLVFMEGLDTIYTEDEIFPALTPNLHQLNEEGWQLDNLLPVEGALWTMGGIVSSLCGTPLLHNLGLDGNVVLFTGFLDRATCLPDVLDKAGYRQVFMGGASMDFGGKGEFLGAHAFGRVLGREELIPELDNPSHLGGWGLYDESLLALALEEYTELAESGRPFNLTVLTVDTHHPTGEPSPDCPSYDRADNSILQAVHCTDYLVGRFIGQLKQHPAYENTVVVLASDHLGMRNNAFPLFPESYERKLYFNVLNAEPAVPADRLATPMDLAPTLLSLMQVQHNASFLAGGDLSQGVMLKSEDAEIFGERQELIRFINSNYLSSQGTGGVLYSLEQSRLAEFDFSQHVTDTRLSSRGLSFTSIGDDPYILLPELTLDSPSQARLYITVETEQASTLTIYYTSDENPNYSEASTIGRGTAAGENHLVFNLGDIARTGRLRIDPGANRGNFLISRIEIRL